MKYTPSEELIKVYNEHHIKMDSILNLRDLGGYIGADGRKVKSGLLYRSGRLAEASDNDMLKLNDMGIVNVCDFRSEGEANYYPDRIIDGANYYRWDVIEHLDESEIGIDVEVDADDEIGWMVKYAITDIYKDVYDNMLLSEKAQKGYREFFKVLFLNIGKPILWHCSEGKDRTGFASAIILEALGVATEDIINDYDASNVPFSDRRNELYNKGIERGYDVEVCKRLAYMGGVNPEYVTDSVACVIKEYGNFENYCTKALDFPDNAFELLKATYLED